MNRTPVRSLAVLLRDPISAATHGAAFLVSIVVTIDLIVRARRQGFHPLPFAAFGVGMMFCYAASALFHALVLPLDRLDVYRLMDHSAIYLLIAGTNTPVLWFLTGKTAFRRNLLILTWTLAVTGIVLKWSLPAPPYWAVVTPYLALGWIGLIPLPRLWRSVGARRLFWLFIGGVSYSVGAVIDWLGTQRLGTESFGAHEIFHLLTIAGTVCHVVFVRRSVMNAALHGSE